MAEDNPKEQAPEARLTFGQWAKRAGLFVLFGTILMIPRIRRLRRRLYVWSCIRLVAVGIGGWLLWRYKHAHAGVLTLTGGWLFLAFSVFVRAKQVTKSVDTMAQEVGALIVLNGGTFQESPDSTFVSEAQICVQPDQIIVVGPRERRLLEIPLAKVRSLTAHSVSNGAASGDEPWKVEVNWTAEEPCTTTFHYDGVFAEHLARVTESTLRSQWKKDLPVIPS
jgi:hypothetical protein